MVETVRSYAQCKRFNPKSIVRNHKREQVRFSAALGQPWGAEASPVFGNLSSMARTNPALLLTNILFAVSHLSEKGQCTSRQERDPEPAARISPSQKIY